ncbi:MAG TPA: carboxypeptidase regulatory-like domain-containing protein, partial [Thermoanaerobaculia bacterium]
AASGEPLEGATVQVESGTETDAFGIKRSSTDSRGYYAVDGLESGSFQVSARKEGYQAKTQPVTIGSASSEHNVALSRGAGLAIHAVDGQTGLPMRMVSLLIFAANGSVAHQGFVSLDNEGKGELAALSPGRYTVYAFAEGYAPRNIPSITVPSGTLSLAFTPGGAVEIRSASGGSARILDAAGALYMARWGRLDGQIALSPPVTRIDHLAPGSYRLVTGEGSESFTVVEGRTTTVEAR